MRAYLALSCLQSRTSVEAWEELVALAPDGIQLTPGCVASPGFKEKVSGTLIPVAYHHSFEWNAYRGGPLWGEKGVYLGHDSRSIHPPSTKLGVNADVWIAKQLAEDHDLVFETMYPGYLLGSGPELEAAMDARLRLAVDVSHVFIQKTKREISDQTLKRLFDYDKVEEIHVSSNKGLFDSHFPLETESFGLEWARERGAEVPVVLESYLHKLTQAGRQQQLDLVRSAP